MSTTTARNSPIVTLSRRSFALGVVNGFTQQVGASLIDPQTILAVFVFDLMRGPHGIIWLGLLNSLMAVGWFWPAALLANRMATASRLQPYYNLSAGLRILLRFAIWVSVATVGGDNPLLLFVLLAALSLAFSSAGGLGMIPFLSVMTDAIPPDWRGKFMAARSLIGNLLAFCAGLYVRRLLTATGRQLWANYSLLFLLSAVFTSIGLIAWALVREPPRDPQRRSLPLWKQFLRGPRVYRRDRNFRRLVRARLLVTFVFTFTFPFVTPFAISNHLAGKSAAGSFLAASMVGLTVSNILWAYVSDRLGNRLVVVMSTALGAVTPILILMAGLLSHLPGAGPGLTLGYLLLMFFLMGACQSGHDVGQTNYLLEVAPAPLRSTYLGFYHLVLVPAAFGPFFGALIIGSGGHYALGFAISSVAAVAALINALRMEEVRWDGSGQSGSPATTEMGDESGGE